MWRDSSYTVTFLIVASLPSFVGGTAAAVETNDVAVRRVARPPRRIQTYLGLRDVHFITARQLLRYRIASIMMFGIESSPIFWCAARGVLRSTWVARVSCSLYLLAR
jgi:hypothetical protein